MTGLLKMTFLQMKNQERFFYDKVFLKRFFSNLEKREVKHCLRWRVVSVKTIYHEDLEKRRGYGVVAHERLTEPRVTMLS